MKKIAIVGFGVENQATYWFLTKDKNNQITICDQNDSLELPDGVKSQLGNDYLEDLNNFDVIVRTVGMHPQIIIDKNPEVESKITTAVNLFFENNQTPTIGVTGTKGKGTTSTLITKILEAAGKKAVLCGNIGTPMLDMIDEAQKADFVVLELSSFQLFDLKYSPNNAVCLMVVPEHLNWHVDMEDYKNAKKNLFRFQKSSDRVIFNALNKNSTEIAEFSPAKIKLTYAVGDPATELADAYVSDDYVHYRNQKIIKTSEVGLLGKHNLQNICAAVAATFDLIDGNIKAIKSAIKAFTGLPHRIEYLREINGVRYYNDSFASGLHATTAAVNAISEPMVLILGGYDRMLDLDFFGDFAKQNEDKFRKLLIIGESAERLAKTLSGHNFNNYVIDKQAQTMKQIVNVATELAHSGDAVVLSPGFASFDLFKNFEDRGNQFRKIVGEL